MPAFRTTRHVAYAAEDMYRIVSDVERYPEFLPLCEGLRIKSRDDLPDGTSRLVATMTVGFKAIRESFTTQVRLDPAAPKIAVTYLDGPFSHLENEWTFVTQPTGSVVGFFIDYEFRSPFLAMIAGAAFDKAVRSYTDAFERRAQAIYGESAK